MSQVLLVGDDPETIEWLEGVVEAEGFTVATADSLRPSLPGPLLTVRIGSTLEETNRCLIEATLAECGNVKRKAAEILGISLKTLYNRLAVYRSRAGGEGDEVVETPAGAPSVRRARAPLGRRT